MQALVLTRGIPESGRAGDGRTRHLLTVLRAAGFDTHLACLVNPVYAGRDAAHLSDLVSSIKCFPIQPGRMLSALGHFLVSGSYLEVTHRQDAMADYVAQMMPHVGLVVCTDALHHAMVAAARPRGPCNLSEQRPFYLLDLGQPHSHCLTIRARIGSGPGSVARRIEAAALRKLERRAAEYADLTLLATHLDLELLAEQLTGGKLWAVFNGVDVPELDEQSARRGDNILFCGSMDHDQNRKAAAWFAHKVMPAVLRQRPMSQLLLPGAGHCRAMRSVCKLSYVATKDLTGNALTLGMAMQQCAVGVAPQREARGAIEPALWLMGRAIPVVATRAVAICMPEDVGAGPIIAQHAEQLASTIVKVLADPEHAQQTGRRARELVERCATWEAQWRRVGALLATLATGEMPLYGSDHLAARSGDGRSRTASSETTDAHRFTQMSA